MSTDQVLQFEIYKNFIGGTGKSYIANALLDYVRSIGGIALAVSSSGIASLLLHDGKTAHSQFKIPLKADGETFCNIPRQSKLADLIRQADLILWDEITMMSKHCFSSLSRTIKDLTGKDDFGGKVIVFAGDFRQTLPVVQRGNEAQIVNECIGNADFWPRVRKMALKRNMRVEAAVGTDRIDMEEFVKWQMQIGNGLDENGISSDTVEIPEDMIAQTQDELISAIFPDPDNPGDDCAILAPRNIDCDAINETILSRVTGPVIELLSADKLLDAEEEEGVAPRPNAANLHHNYPIEYLNSLSFSGLPPHKLRLKIGCVVMLLRNLNIKQGLCNGVRLRVLENGNRFLKCEIITGSHSGNIALLPRISLNPDDDKLPFPMQRLQFPIKLAYAITINKAQGQSLSRVGVFLMQDVFGHGQFYVAASRAIARSRIKFYLGDHPDNRSVKNVVYRQALLFSS
jgi:hypothetical protein